MAEPKERYVIAYDGLLSSLVSEVNDYIAEGYYPHGSMVFNGKLFYQPMIFTGER